MAAASADAPGNFNSGDSPPQGQTLDSDGDLSDDKSVGLLDLQLEAFTELVSEDGLSIVARGLGEVCDVLFHILVCACHHFTVLFHSTSSKIVQNISRCSISVETIFILKPCGIESAFSAIWNESVNWLMSSPLLLGVFFRSRSSSRESTQALLRSIHAGVRCEHDARTAGFLHGTTSEGSSRSSPTSRYHWDEHTRTVWGVSRSGRVIYNIKNLGDGYSCKAHSNAFNYRDSRCKRTLRITNIYRSIHLEVISLGESCRIYQSAIWCSGTNGAWI